MSEAVETLDGWWALHDLRRVDWSRWKSLSPQQRDLALGEARSFFQKAFGAEAEDRGSSGLFRVLGHKGDLLQIHLRERLEDLADLETDFDRTALAEVLQRRTSYLSVVELSTYGAKEGKAPDGNPLDNPYVRGRLHPRLPRTASVCFYPMDKRRGETSGANWYDLPMETRRELMAAHGLVGRKYAGKVTQIITGSVGLDDFEWGVTLFADDPLQFKKLVYEMRFDEVSARFALFGPFYVGLRMDLQDLERHLAL